MVEGLEGLTAQAGKSDRRGLMSSDEGQVGAKWKEVRDVPDN